MIVSANYALNSLAWSVIGFVAGIGAGQVWKAEMHALWEKSRARMAWFRLDYVLIVLAVCTCVFVFVRTQTLENRSHCQAQFNDEFRQVTSSRAKYADDDRDSLNKLLKVIATTSATPKQNADFSAAVQAYAVTPTSENLVQVFKVLAEASKTSGGVKQSEALQTYLKETAAADAKRAAHPLPKLSEKCGS